MLQSVNIFNFFYPFLCLLIFISENVVAKELVLISTILFIIRNIVEMALLTAIIDFFLNYIRRSYFENSIQWKENYKMEF